MMGQEEAVKQFLEQKRRLKRHLTKMRSALPEAFDVAFDRYYETEALNYLKIEEKLFRFGSLIAKLEDEVDVSEGPSQLRQVAGRVNYIADQLDAVEATLYRRSRRRRRSPFSFSNFFSGATGQNPNGSASWTEVSTLTEAYQILDLEQGCSLAEVITAFRRLAKKYHPDARGGDRTDEKQLRRVVEAYQVIKADLHEG